MRWLVSGWNLARRAPKVVQRAMPACVYWFDRLVGYTGQIARWVAARLWPSLDTLSPEAL